MDNEELKKLWNDSIKVGYVDYEENLHLYGRDSGGYDATGAIQLIERDDGLFLEFNKWDSKKSEWTLIKMFKLTIQTSPCPQ